MILALSLSMGSIAIAQTPPATTKPAVLRTQLSDAGKATVKKWLGQPDPQQSALAKQRRAAAADIDTTISGPSVDLAKFEAGLRQGEKIESAMRARANTLVLGMLKELTPADRTAFLQTMRAASQQRAAAAKP